MNIYPLINQYVFYLHVFSSYIYIYIYILTYVSCIILFHGVRGFSLKRYLSNFLPKIRNICIDYF